MTKTLIVIPARMASSRFPNKPLASILGTTMIRRVYNIAKACKLADKVVIATDDKQIAQSMQDADVVLTSKECKTGTDRVAQTLDLLDEQYDIAFSLQGDAVLTPPWVIDKVIEALHQNPDVGIATPAVLLHGQAKVDFIQSKHEGSSTGTCVVFDKNNRALYFSKSLIPYARNGYDKTPIYRHIGLYGYRAQTLKQITNLEQTVLEQTECLEQLRALENNIPIQVVEVDYKGRTHGSVDRLEDVAIVESIIKQEGELVL